jgi:hypothetical protein
MTPQNLYNFVITESKCMKRLHTILHVWRAVHCQKYFHDHQLTGLKAFGLIFCDDPSRQVVSEKSVHNSGTENTMQSETEANYTETLTKVHNNFVFR